MKNISATSTLKYGWFLSLFMLVSVILIDLFDDSLRIDWELTDLDAIVEFIHLSFYFVMGAAFVGSSIALLRSRQVKKANN